MNYREIYKELEELTDNFKLDGQYITDTKSERDTAIDILKDYYDNITKGLNRTDDPNSKQYLIRFDQPRGDYMNEAMIEKHDQLNPKLWDKNNELRPEVRGKIELIVQKFKDNLKEDDINIDIVDTILVGSNCSYNYNDTSDLDIHIIVDLRDYSAEIENLADKLYNAYRRLFNDRYEISLNGVPAEIYVETLKDGD